MRNFIAVIVCALVSACGGRSDSVLIASEINMLGIRHDLNYRGDTLSSITYRTFIASSATDTTKIDTVIRRDIDSLIYEPDNSIVLFRTFSRHGTFGKVHRRFRFNEDNFLVSISRFNGDVEYTTDSVSYDYTARKAYYHDLVNKTLEELEYDRDDNITTIYEGIRGGPPIALVGDDQDQYAQLRKAPVKVTYNYFNTSEDPFLINLDEGDLLFGCFHRKVVSLFWNAGRRPEFRSAHNVQAVKKSRNNSETNALFEYQLKDGLPTACYGGDGVVFYRYMPTP